MKAEISKEMMLKIEELQSGHRSKVEFTPEQDAVILEYYEKKNKSQLAKLLGVAEGTMRNRYRELKK